MSEPRRFDEATGLALLERLAAGDLPEVARRDLFAWLDEDISRWRRCAQALLEAREIELAFDDLASDFVIPPAEAILPPTEPKVTPRNGQRHSLLIALSVFVAFGLGVAVEGWRQGNDRQVVQAPAGNSDVEKPVTPREPATPTRVREENREDYVPEKDPTPVLVAQGLAGDGAEMLAPYVRSQWEKQGYLVTESREMVSVSLPNGQKLQVPVDQVQFNYVGQRSY
jgi:hypothetical protein